MEKEFQQWWLSRQEQVDGMIENINDIQVLFDYVYDICHEAWEEATKLTFPTIYNPNIVNGEPVRISSDDN